MPSGRKSKAEQRGAVVVAAGFKSPVVVLNAEVMETVDAAIAAAEAVGVIESNEQFSDADEAYKEVYTLEKTIDRQRLEAKRPVTELGKKIDAAAKEPIDRLHSVRDALGTKIKTYQDEQDRIRREAEEEARRQAQAQQEQAAHGSEVIPEEADFGDGLPPAPVVAPPPVVKSSAVRSKTTYRLEIDDLDQVPMKLGGVRLWKLDERACLTLMKAGAQIPGLRRVKEEGTAAR